MDLASEENKISLVMRRALERIAAEGGSQAEEARRALQEAERLHARSKTAAEHA